MLNSRRHQAAAADLKLILKAVSRRVETPPSLIAKVHRPSKAKRSAARLFGVTVDSEPAIIEYEPDSDLRDTEQVPFLEDRGIQAFTCREVLPNTPDAWIKGGRGPFGAIASLYAAVVGSTRDRHRADGRIVESTS